GGRRQQDVALGNRAYRRTQHADFDLVVGQLLQGIRQNFGRAADVGLEDDVEILNFAGLQLIVQLIERQAGVARHGYFARLHLAIHHDLLGLGRIGDRLERLAYVRNRLQAQYFDGSGWLGFANRFSTIIEHGADFSEYGSA